MTPPSPTVAIIGATGAVGRELLALLEQRALRIGEARPLASARSAGARVAFRGEDLTVRELSDDALAGVDVAFFTAGSSVSRQWAPRAVEAGAVVIDNSSAFRLNNDVPLIVPEINGEALDRAGDGPPRLIANPNCSTIIMLAAVDPLRLAFGVRRISACTYQAASGAGARAVEELKRQTREALDGRTPEPELFNEIYAFNLFSHDSPVDPRTGRNAEEQKMIDESRKIWNAPDLAVTATCVRVPVMRAHAVAINVSFERPASEEEARAALESAPGLRLLDDRSSNRFPTPLAATGRDDVLVGRLRPDETQPAERDRWAGFDLLACGDQVRKGAALNAVQIAERLVLRG